MACGLTSDFLYNRLKAAEEQGSEAAGQLLRDFMLIAESSSEAVEGNAEATTASDEEETVVT